MAATIEFAEAVITEKVDETSFSEASQNDFRPESQPTSESSLSSEIINNTPSATDSIANSQSVKIGEHIDPPTDAESVEESKQSNGNDDRSLDNAPNKKAKKKYRSFLDSDSDEEEDIVPSLLDKNNSDNEKSSSTESSKSKKSHARPKVSKTGLAIAQSPYDEPNKKAKKKYRSFLDSDSDEEDDTVPSLLDKNNSDDEKSSSSESSKSKKSNVLPKVRKAINSDSEDDDNKDAATNGDIDDEDNNLNDKVKNRLNALVDSESEDDAAPNNSAQSSPEVDKKKASANHKNKIPEKTKKSKLTALIDTDSDGDNENNKVNNSLAERGNDAEHSTVKKGKPAKKRTGSARASKDEAMRQIHSETQRLIRSSEVSLPYHRPKQRSLQDFLNRKQFIPALPEGLTTAAKVKMSSEIVSKVLEEKEKEAELFYKSSDSEDETIDLTPANVETIKESSNPDSSVSQIAIEDTQKHLKNDIQNAHNKKEIIQQGAVDLGVPRKLFANEATETMETDAVAVEVMDDEEDSECGDPRMKAKETKQGLREVSVPRKLFSSDYDEGVGSQSRNYDVSTLVPAKNIDSEAMEEQTESFDEGIDSLEQDKEFPEKIGSLPLGNIEKNECNTGANGNAEGSNISETPFISNKEIGKSKEKGETSRQLTEFDDSSDEFDMDDPQSIPGYIYGIPPDMDEDAPKIPPKSNIKSKVLSAASSVCPKLRGAPGMMIDFSNVVKPDKDGVKSLLDRFYRHSAVTKPAEVNATVTVLHTEKTADGIQVVEHTLPYSLPTNDCLNEKDLNKPGAKHLRLKSELIEKMAKKRGEEWKLKEQQEKEKEEGEEYESEEIEDESDNEIGGKLVDEEIEPSGESEPEENDMPERREKPKKSSEFVDEEAEVSGEEHEAGIDRDDDDEEEDDENREENSTHGDDDDEAGSNSSDEDEDEETTETTNKKRSSRIIKAFEDDSNPLPEAPSQNGVDATQKVFQRTRTDVDMFETEDGNDGWLSDTELPPSQILPRDHTDARSQLCKTPLTAINVLRFVSPITQLTALNSSGASPRDNSATKSLSSLSQMTMKSSVERTPVDDGSPALSDSEKRIGFQKKLFQDQSGTVNDEDLRNLCSGTFTGTETDDRVALTVSSHGKLSTSSQVSQMFKSSLDSFDSQAASSHGHKNTTRHTVDETSQDITLTLDEDSQDFLGRGKGTEDKSTISRDKFKVASSSDDEDESRDEPKRKKKVLKKKKVKQLELSDDEDANEFSYGEEEEEEHELPCNDTEDRYVDYDSEENEVVIVPKKDIKKVAADFLDAEAELSESEWGSADEDEKDMDKLELEEGDDEEIDEKQMRDQLGKMHVKQILDDDRRDVRMLQELLFEDGDLHTDGGGRERKFRWKNIDNLGEDGNIGPKSDEVDENGEQLEEENDLEWRKLRLERDKFIQEQMNTPTDDVESDSMQGSQILKLGMKALSKRKPSHCVQESEEPAAKKPIVPRTVMDLLGSPAGGTKSKILHKAVKRGSFLARGEESLARIAVQIKQTDTTIVTRTNPGNFVFAHISPSVAAVAVKGQRNVTESEVDSPVDAKTRKRKPPAGITPRTAKKAKVDLSHSSGKKLF